jgi:cytochrome c oxidase cbb3-type subunit 2
MYDRPFQWGSKRTGPDLARVGGKYSDEWHKVHLDNPRAIVPGSIMPSYSWLGRTDLVLDHIATDMKVLAALGVPYSAEMIAKAIPDLKTQATADDADAEAFVQRYSKAQVRDFDGDPKRITEADALIAYLQMLGMQVDFKLYDDKANIR